MVVSLAIALLALKRSAGLTQIRIGVLEIMERAEGRIRSKLVRDPVLVLAG